MPYIVLKYPFIRHYAGVVLELPDPIGVSGWDDDERVREKISYFDKRCYHLPDDGKGRPALLPVTYTRLCPGNLFDLMDLKSGPCRITSVSQGLSKSHLNHFESLVPEGLGSVHLYSSDLYRKNLIKVVHENPDLINRVILTDLQTQTGYPIAHFHDTDLCVDVSLIHPGFYRVDLLHDEDVLHHFTLIKLFPVTVFFNQNDDKFHTEVTIW